MFTAALIVLSLFAVEAHGRSYCDNYLSVCDCCSEGVYSKTVRLIALKSSVTGVSNNEAVEVEYDCCGRSVYKTYEKKTNGETNSVWNRYNSAQIQTVRKETNIRRSYYWIEKDYTRGWQRSDCRSCGWAGKFYEDILYDACFLPSTTFLDVNQNEVTADKVEVGTMVQTLSSDGNSVISTPVQLAKQHNASVPLDYIRIQLFNIANATDEAFLSVTARHGMILLGPNGVPDPVPVKANTVVRGNRMIGLQGTVWEVLSIEPFKLNTTVQMVTSAGTVLANGILCTTENLP